MATRLNALSSGHKIVIMQRLHESDLTGDLLAKGGYDLLCLPAEFEPGDSVAKSGEGRELALLSRSLRGDAEQLADEFHLGYHISFACPSHPPFSDHVHRLNATQGPPRCRH